jgi:chromatin remodeling complex protein RSC6
MPTKTTSKTSEAKDSDAAAKPVKAKKADAAAKPAKAKDGAADAKPVKAKKVAQPAEGRKPNALQQPLQPSEDLAAVVGSDKLARGEAVSKVWAYIKEHKLQNPKDGREILADDKLGKVFGKSKVTMFEMNKHLAQHLK